MQAQENVNAILSELDIVTSQDFSKNQFEEIERNNKEMVTKTKSKFMNRSLTNYKK